MEIGEVAFGAAAMWLSISEAIGLHHRNPIGLDTYRDNTHIFYFSFISLFQLSLDSRIGVWPSSHVTST